MSEKAEQAERNGGSGGISSDRGQTRDQGGLSATFDEIERQAKTLNRGDIDLMPRLDRHTPIRNPAKAFGQQTQGVAGGWPG